MPSHSLLNLEQLKTGLIEISSQIKPQDIVFLSGPVGAGKTTCIQELMLIWDFEEATSPTYNLVQCLKPNSSLSPFKRIFHLDIYRLKSLDEMFYLGLETQWDQKSLMLIEWGELYSLDAWQDLFKGIGLTFKQFWSLEIQIPFDNPHSRYYEFKPIG